MVVPIAVVVEAEAVVAMAEEVPSATKAATSTDPHPMAIAEVVVVEDTVAEVEEVVTTTEMAEEINMTIATVTTIAPDLDLAMVAVLEIMETTTTEEETIEDMVEVAEVVTMIPMAEEAEEATANTLEAVDTINMRVTRINIMEGINIKAIRISMAATSSNTQKVIRDPTTRQVATTTTEEALTLDTKATASHHNTPLNKPLNSMCNMANPSMVTILPSTTTRANTSNPTSLAPDLEALNINHNIPLLMVTLLPLINNNLDSHCLPASARLSLLLLRPWVLVTIILINHNKVLSKLQTSISTNSTSNSNRRVELLVNTNIIPLLPIRLAHFSSDLHKVRL